jgi:hypothetical protein
MSTVSLPLYAHVHALALYVTWLQDRQPNATGLDGRVRCRVAAASWVPDVTVRLGGYYPVELG